MPHTPSDDETRLKRIQVLCAEVSKRVRTSRQQRQAARKLAESASTVQRKAKTQRKS